MRTQRTIAKGAGMACAILACFSSMAAAEVRVVGSDSVRGCQAAIIKAYKAQKGGDVSYHGGGSYLGIAMLCAGKADVAVIGAPMAERWKSQLRQAFPNPDRQPSEIIFSQTALLIVVHPRNPLKGMNVPQLRAIFTRKVTNWAAARGTPGEIHLYGPGLTRNSTIILRNQILGGIGWSAEGVTFCDDANGVLAAVAKDPAGIGYLLAPPDKELQQVHALAIATKPGQKPVPPTRENVLADVYPLGLKVRFLIHPDAPQEAIDYCKFACSDAVIDITHKWGIFPVTERKETLAGKRLQEMKAGKGPTIEVVRSTPGSS